MTSWDEYRNKAVEAAKAAEDIIRHYYHGNFEIERKEDATPVTVADVECERAIKKVLSNAFPEHGFYGEELGRESIDSDYVWLIDPIDGTKSFVRGYPFFSTQIALMYKGELVVGVSNAPMFGQGELATAAKGSGATLNGETIHVSDIDKLKEATLSLGNIATLVGTDQWQGLGKLIQTAHRHRGYGDFYHYHLLAAGRIDLIVESDLNILDIAALTVIVREAGGDITQLDGEPIDLETTSMFASNGRISKEARACLGV